MSSLNELEKAVLEQMVRQAPDDLRVALKEKIDSAEVTGRKNTGAGFYAKLKVGKTSTSIKARVVDNVWADIEGFAQSMTFLVFLEDGAIHTLEGAAIDDSTVDVDFSNVRFAIKPG